MPASTKERKMPKKNAKRLDKARPPASTKERKMTKENTKRIDKARPPASTKECQITKENTKRLAALVQSNGKNRNWNAIKNILLTYHPNKEGAPDLHGLLCRALHQAITYRSGQSITKMILQKLKHLSLHQRVHFACMAVRCKNMEALKVIVDDDPSVVFFCTNDENGKEVTLLHLVCQEHGWNKEIKFILEQILKHNDHNVDANRNTQTNLGLFHEMEDSRMPLALSMQAGSNLDKIMWYLRDKHPAYLKANLNRLSGVIAKYCDYLELISDLNQWYDYALMSTSHPKDGSTPLSYACYYQNSEMIHGLLCEYLTLYECDLHADLDTYGCLLHVQNRLLDLNNQGVSPLEHLLLNVGEADAENVWRCIDSCTGFFRNPPVERRESRPLKQFEFCICHLFLSHMWQKLIAKKNCMKILDQIIHRLEIDVCSVDEDTGKTLLSIVIEKISMSCTTNDTKKNIKSSLKILDYLIGPATAASTPGDSRPAVTRDGSGRLPLHSACDQSLPWKRGLETIVNANLPALESVDPITGLPPFAHCAVGAKSDLESIFELLRLHPGSIDSALKPSVAN